MRSVLSITLYNKKEKILELNDITYQRQKNVISFVHENIKYKIGVGTKNYFFFRESDEFLFSLDITNNICTYLLKETNTTLNIGVTECSLTQKKDEIVIVYEIESVEGKNQVHIYLKEGE